MLMTRETDYALRILRALYQEEQLSAAAIAQREHIPKAITLKLLKRLRAAGFVSSLRGAAGGYRINDSCGELYLWHLFRALDESQWVNRCQKPGYRCENRPRGDCGICKELSRIQTVLDAELQRTPLCVMFQECQEA